MMLCCSLDSDRRKKLVRQLLSRGVKVNTRRVFGIQREEHLLTAKIVLNVHYHDDRLFETVRMQLLTSLQRFIISEDTPDTAAMEEFGNAVVFVPYEHLSNVRAGPLK